MLKKIILFIVFVINAYAIVYIGLSIRDKIKNNTSDKTKEEKIEIITKQDTEEPEENNIEEEVITKNNEEKENIVPVKKSKDVAVSGYRNMLFQYRNSRPKKVFIVGSFNNWKAGKDTLKKGNNHTWTINYKLSPGKYYYNYIIDGNKWIADPNNPKKENKGPKGLCSVIEVKPK